MPERDLVAGIVQLGNALTRNLAPVFEKSNVTPQQWAVLCAIAEAGEPLTLAGVARVMLVSKQNMTGMITRLEQLGFVDRAGDPTDLRSARVTLTRRGRSVVEKLRPVYEQWLESISGGAMAPRDLQSLSHLVNKMIDALEGEDA